jgi:hypothetical protein
MANLRSEALTASSSISRLRILASRSVIFGLGYGNASLPIAQVLLRILLVLQLPAVNGGAALLIGERLKHLAPQRPKVIGIGRGIFQVCMKRARSGLNWLSIFSSVSRGPAVFMPSVIRKTARSLQEFYHRGSALRVTVQLQKWQENGKRAIELVSGILRKWLRFN